jgi:hypothetical protein
MARHSVAVREVAIVPWLECGPVALVSHHSQLKPTGIVKMDSLQGRLRPVLETQRPIVFQENKTVALDELLASDKYSRGQVLNASIQSPKLSASPTATFAIFAPFAVKTLRNEPRKARNTRKKAQEAQGDRC